MNPEPPNLAYLWAALLIEEAVRQGVGLFVVCPGSRSTPLAVAVAQNPRAEALVHWDERAAAFAALGFAKATGRPAAVLTTSGTAVANLLPATVEARQAGVPLLLLTADRPPELRETGANQAVRQVGLFATVARWAFDVPPPAPEVDPAFVLTTVAQAVARTLDPPGPVHLNLQFREPLGAQPDGTDVGDLLGPLSPWRSAPDRPYTRVQTASPLVDATLLADVVQRMPDSPEGVVVLGEVPSWNLEATRAAAKRLAEALGWPLLTDALSSARPDGIASADLLLASEAARRRLRPQAVILLGGRPTSKRLLTLLAASRPDPYLVVHPGDDRLDPHHRVTHRLRADVSAAAGELARAFRRKGIQAMDGWARAWETAAAAASSAASPLIEASGLSEPAVARRVAAGLPAGGTLVVAASMPIRDVEAFADGAAPGVAVLANRGASGIDGTVATAAGAARGRGGRTALLIGDLALLHDLTSLSLLRSGPPVVVVVVNNDGGGIFHFLPIARGPEPLAADVFEPMFGTPHGLGFEDAARQFGLVYAAPQTLDAFDTAYDEACRSDVSTLIEVRTDRADNAALHVRITEAVANAVDAALAAEP